MRDPRSSFVGRLRSFGRLLGPTEPELGPLARLPGTWKSTGGTGWNMIALPFADGPFKYRLLVNQYDETLTFSVVGKDIPNRGIAKDSAGNTTEADQTLASLDYQQDITQIAADDSPHSGMAGEPNTEIHHEPGLWLYMRDQQTAGLNIARLGTIPHGDSILALGTSAVQIGGPTIPDISGLPIGITDDLETSPYLEPYKHYRDKPFQGVFDPTSPNDLLKVANKGVPIARTTALPVDSTVETGGIVNIPFVTRQANATEVKATFWIEELALPGPDGKPVVRLQYSQVVMLDFFPRNDDQPGLIKWPHVSINTLEKVSD